MNAAVKRQRKSRANKSLVEIMELLNWMRSGTSTDGIAVIRDTLLLVFISLQRKEISNLDAKALCFFLREKLSRLTLAVEERQFLMRCRN